MPNERDLRNEIGHVLFIDIVGYSKRLIVAAVSADRFCAKDSAHFAAVPANLAELHPGSRLLVVAGGGESAGAAETLTSCQAAVPHSDRSGSFPESRNGTSLLTCRFADLSKPLSKSGA